jgi:hypothetical protein
MQLPRVSRKSLETASWIAGILSLILAGYVWLRTPLPDQSSLPSAPKPQPQPSDWSSLDPAYARYASSISAIRSAIEIASKGDVFSATKLLSAYSRETPSSGAEAVLSVGMDARPKLSQEQSIESLLSKLHDRPTDSALRTSLVDALAYRRFSHVATPEQVRIEVQQAAALLADTWQEDNWIRLASPLSEFVNRDAQIGALCIAFWLSPSPSRLGRRIVPDKPPELMSVGERSALIAEKGCLRSPSDIPSSLSALKASIPEVQVK